MPGILFWAMLFTVRCGLVKKNRWLCGLLKSVTLILSQKRQIRINALTATFLAQFGFLRRQCRSKLRPSRK